MAHHVCGHSGWRGVVLHACAAGICAFVVGMGVIVIAVLIVEFVVEAGDGLGDCGGSDGVVDGARIV